MGVLVRGVFIRIFLRSTTVSFDPNPESTPALNIPGLNLLNSSELKRVLRLLELRLRSENSLSKDALFSNCLKAPSYVLSLIRFR